MVIAVKNIKLGIKYYNLEKFLFEEVTKNFKEKGCLAEEDFFAVVTWKSNRSKTKIMDGIKESKRTVEEITAEIHKEKEQEKKVNILLAIKGIGISIASAILTVCYPEDFTILDYRVWGVLKKGEVVGKENPPTTIGGYFKYVDVCKEQAKEFKLTLRDFDQAMWGLSFYEDLQNELKKHLY